MEDNTPVTGDSLPDGLVGQVIVGTKQEDQDPGGDLKNALTYSTIASALATGIMVFVARSITPALDGTEFAALMGFFTVVINGGLVLLKKFLDRTAL